MYEAFDRIEKKHGDDFLEEMDLNAISKQLQKTQNDINQNEKLAAFSVLLLVGMVYFAPKEFCIIYSPILVVALLGMLRDEVHLSGKAQALQEVNRTPLLELDDYENIELNNLYLWF